MKALIPRIAAIIGLGVLACSFSSLASSLLAIPANTWSCRLAFEGKMGGITSIFGRLRMQSAGYLDCVHANGDIELIPVEMNFQGAPSDGRQGLGVTGFAGESAESTTVFSPRELFGEYDLSEADSRTSEGVTTLQMRKLGGGPGFEVAIRVSGGQAMNVDLRRLSLRGL